MSQVYRLPQGGRINRGKLLRFSFNGKNYTAYEGDTLASALLANGINLVGRSFKYHRPRGIIGSGAEEPNAIVQIDKGATTTPNLRATQVYVYDGLIASSVNAWPSLEYDIGELNSVFSRILPAGFYYKTFMWPQSFWPKYEHVIRKASGLGSSPKLPDPDRYEKTNRHCDVLIVGAGPSGLSAAYSAASTGARVILVDEKNELGGSLLDNVYEINSEPADQWVQSLVIQLEGMDNITIIKNAQAYGYFEQNFVTINEKVKDPDPTKWHKNMPRERMWRVRAKQVILATGSIERPLVFHNNDRPGVMLASAASSYINRFGVVPGESVVVFTNNDSAYRTVLDLVKAKVRVVAVVDYRANTEGDLVQQVSAKGITIYYQHVISNVDGKKRVNGVSIAPVDDSDNLLIDHEKKIECDTVLMSGGWSPVVHLFSQSGGKTKWDDNKYCFVPGNIVQQQIICGSANGSFELHECLKQGHEAGQEAVKLCGYHPSHEPLINQVEKHQSSAIKPLWLAPSHHGAGKGGKQFVDYQNDTTANDIKLAVREGFKSIEHIKRYTALGFGTDQGKMGNINGMGIAAADLNQSIPQTGTTTFRPPYTPVTFGAVAGADIGDLFAPIRKTAMHQWHEKNNAEFENVGDWKRPWYYPHKTKSGTTETLDEAVARECLAVRNSVGIIDASTLGKIDIKGPDAGEFLNRIYSNAWKALAVGKCRYGFMLREDGMVMDDGVSTRIADDHYYMTTTTGGAASVYNWLEQWLQTEWPELKVFISSVTDHWATISLSGPNARHVMEQVCTDIDFENESFPFMSMEEGSVAGVAARVFRISFSGELAYEINVPANYGQHVWDACMKAGEAYDITPYGTETMHVLRAEKGFIIVGQDTDGSVTPHDLGMSWIVSKKKDFIGNRSLSRSDCVRDGRKQLVGLTCDITNQVIPEGSQLVNSAELGEMPVAMVGHVSSSYYSAALKCSIALALVKSGHSRMGEKVYAPLADGRVLVATICDPVFYDKSGERQHV